MNSKNDSSIPNTFTVACAAALLALGSTTLKAQDSAQPTVPYTQATPPLMSLDMWNSPAFQKRFMESFISVSDVEPRLTEEDKKTLQAFNKLQQENKLQEAQDLLIKSRTKASSPAVDFYLGNIHFADGKWEEALTEYKKAVSDPPDGFPRFQRAWQNMAICYIRLNQYAEALPALTRVVELGGGDSLMFGLLGYCYSQTEKPLSAETAYRMAILLDPKTQDWKMGLAQALFKQQRFAEAATLFGQFIEDDKSNATFWLFQANAYIGMGQPMKAAENYEVVDQLGKSTPESLNTLADIYINNELFDLAVTDYTRAMKMSERVGPERAIRAAKVLAARGANGQTRDMLASIYELRGDKLKDSDKKDLLKLRARLAVAEGAGEEEAKVLQETIDLDPQDGEALILLGQYKARNNKPEEAILLYQRAENLPSFEADAKVRHAQLLVGMGKYDDALILLRSAQQLKPRENVQKFLDQVERAAKSN
ncbi:MAG: tetratricopeptide repeat protein [Phycisphaera sp.]|nr:tetratricopeptide repeat protein [Phycisphaera sp.]